ncbi:MAG: T9SS type A sorting domain-containing protein [Cryomorphaceae bacterium]
MAAILKYGIISLIVTVGSLTSHAQTDIDYQGHKVLTSSQSDEYYFEKIRINRSLESDKLISRFEARGYEPTFFDLALTDTPEIYPFEPLSEAGPSYAVYRSHEIESLETDFSAEILHQGSKSTFNYSEGQIAFEISMSNSNGIAVSNWGEVYDHNLDNFNRNIRVLLNPELNEIYRRDILFKPGGGSFMMLAGEFDSNQGLVNENAQINDFAFRDSLYIIQNEDTLFRYSDEWVTYLEVCTANNIVWSGDLEYSGKLGLRRSILFDLSSFRVFSISGEVDFDPSSQTYDYETPSGETHLVLVKYTNEGNVEWTKTMAKFEEWVEDSGSFHVEMSKDGDERIQLYCGYRGSLASDTVGLFSAFTDGEIIDSGLLTPVQTSRHSPDYIYSLNAETGTEIKVFKIYNNSSNGGYTNRNAARITTQKRGEVSVGLRNTNFFTTPFVVQKLYPDFQEFPLPLNVPADGFRPYQFITLSTSEGADDFKQYSLYYDTNFDGSAILNLRHIPLTGGNMMFAGDVVRRSDVYVGSTLLNFENNPYPDFGSDGLVIFAEESTLPTSDLEPDSPQIKVFPNPTTDYVEVDMESNVLLNYKLFNAMGTLVQAGRISDSNKIAMSGLPQGLYFLHVSDGKNNKRSTVKIEKL